MSSSEESELGWGAQEDWVAVGAPNQDSDDDGEYLNLADLDLRLVAAEMRRGISIRDRTFHTKVFKACFVGQDAVDWMVSSGHCLHRSTAELIGQKMVDEGHIHHVVDDHSFKDKFLFYRYYVDEDYTLPDSLKGGLLSNWRFMPHIRANSLGLTIPLAEDLQRAITSRNDAEIRDCFSVLRHLVRDTARRDASGWTLVKTSTLDSPPAAAAAQAGSARNAVRVYRRFSEGTYQTVRTDGEIAMAPRAFAAGLLDFGRRKQWEALFKEGRVVEVVSALAEHPQGHKLQLPEVVRRTLQQGGGQLPQALASMSVRDLASGSLRNLTAAAASAATAGSAFSGNDGRAGAISPTGSDGSNGSSSYGGGAAFSVGTPSSYAASPGRGFGQHSGHFNLSPSAQQALEQGGGGSGGGTDYSCDPNRSGALRLNFATPRRATVHNPGAHAAASAESSPLSPASAYRRRASLRAGGPASAITGPLPPPRSSFAPAGASGRSLSGSTVAFQQEELLHQKFSRFVRKVMGKKGQGAQGKQGGGGGQAPPSMNSAALSARNSARLGSIAGRHRRGGSDGVGVGTGAATMSMPLPTGSSPRPRGGGGGGGGGASSSSMAAASVFSAAADPSTIVFERDDDSDGDCTDDHAAAAAAAAAAATPALTATQALTAAVAACDLAASESAPASASAGGAAGNAASSGGAQVAGESTAATDPAAAAAEEEAKAKAEAEAAAAEEANPLAGLCPRVIYRINESPTSLAWPRDVCALQDYFEEPNGTCVVYEISVEHPAMPHLQRVVRADVLLHAYVVRPARCRCLRRALTAEEKAQAATGAGTGNLAGAVAGGGVSEYEGSMPLQGVLLQPCSCNPGGRSRVTVVQQFDMKGKIPSWLLRGALDQASVNSFGRLRSGVVQSSSASDARGRASKKPALSTVNEDGDEVEAEADGASDAAASGSKFSDMDGGKSKTCLQDFQLLAVLGRGGYGKVMQVRHFRSRQVLAMKVLRKAEIRRRRQVKRTRLEREVLARAQHPFIVGLRYAFQSKHKLYMVMEFVQGGDFFTHIHRDGPMSDTRIRLYAAELVLALDHLHRMGIVYRDLKPENVLLDRSGHIKLTDFGLSRFFKASVSEAAVAAAAAAGVITPPASPAVSGAEGGAPISVVAANGETIMLPPGETKGAEAAAAARGARAGFDDDEEEEEEEVAYSFCGTEQYMAPEMLLQRGHGKGVDWWCLGIVLAEMATSRHPFRGRHHYDTLRNIVDRAYDPNLTPRYKKPKPGAAAPINGPAPVRRRKKLPATLRHLIRGLLTRDVKRRLGCNGIEEVKGHPFFHSIDWDAVAAMQVEPEWKPAVGDSSDVSNFDNVFTRETPVDSVVQEESELGQAAASGWMTFFPFNVFAGGNGGGGGDDEEGADGGKEGEKKRSDVSEADFEGFSYVAPTPLMNAVMQPNAGANFDE